MLDGDTSRTELLYPSRDHLCDPACGNGNFLVIAYKELRRLEHKILERLAGLDQKHSTLFTDSCINIENFYGIEIDDLYRRGSNPLHVDRKASDER